MTSRRAFAIPTLGDVIVSDAEGLDIALKKMSNGTGRGTVIPATPHVPVAATVAYDKAPDVIQGAAGVWTNLGEIGTPDTGSFNWKPTTRQVVGGRIYSGYYSCSSFYAFDIGAGVWVPLTATTSVGGGDAILGVHGSELVNIEITTGSGNRTKPYDIGTDTWGANRTPYAGNGGTWSEFSSLCQSGNLIYVISGEAFAGTVDAGNDSRETWVYDMGADTWTRLADIPGDGFYSAGSDVGADGKIYCIGGIRDNNPPNFEGVVRVYDPGSDTWDTSRSDPPLPTGISAGYVNFPTVAGLPDGKLLYGGGQGWDNISSTFVDVADFWIYDPATDTFTPTTASSTASDMSWTILDLGNDAPAKDGNDIYIGSGAWSSFAKFTYSP